MGVAVAEEKTTNKSEGAAVVEEAEEHEIVASDNLKVIDPAATQVLTGGKAAEENAADSAGADVKVEKPAVEETTDVKVEVGRSNTEETAGNEEEFNFEESLGWTAVQGRKGRKGKKGLSKLKGIISELKAEEGEKKEVKEEPKVLLFEEVEKKKVIEEPKVLSFEEAAKQVEAESAFAKKTFAAPQSLEVKEDVDTDSSGWEVIEVADESEDEVKEVAEVTEEVKERMSEEEKGCSSQRWVEEMNEKNRKKMELENKATEASTSYSQSTFWREPISQLPNLPNLPKEEKMEQPKKVEEKKPAGISLPTAEMTFDWMDDDEAVGTMDSDDSDDVPDNREN